MTSTNSDYKLVIDNIEAMYAARHLIAQTYCDGSIDITDENAKQLRNLQELRVMRNNVNRDESLRLSSVMMKSFDHAVHRIRTMKGSTNLDDHISRMFVLAEGYQKAATDGRLEDQEVYGSDFDLASYDVAEEVEVMLMHVDTMAHNNFASVTSYAEKIRQNEHYLKEMKRLVEAMGTLNDPALIEILESSLGLQPLYQVYNSHILNNMHKWRAKLLDIIAHLERYMHKVKDLAPRAKRIRAMSMYLHRHPEYSPRDVEDYPEAPEWAFKHDGLTIALHADTRNEDLMESFIPVAKSIERGMTVISKARTGGVFIEDDDLEEERVIYVQPTPFEEAVHALVAHVRGSRVEVSAKSFFESSPHVAGFESRVTLMCLASLLDNTPKRSLFGFDDLRVMPQVEQEADASDGNIYIRDIELFNTVLAQGVAA